MCCCIEYESSGGYGGGGGGTRGPTSGTEGMIVIGCGGCREATGARILRSAWPVHSGPCAFFQTSPAVRPGPGSKSSFLPCWSAISHRRQQCVREFRLPARKPQSSFGQPAVAWPKLCFIASGGKGPGVLGFGCCGRAPVDCSAFKMAASNGPSCA